MADEATPPIQTQTTPTPDAPAPAAPAPVAELPAGLGAPVDDKPAEEVVLTDEQKAEAAKAAEDAAAAAKDTAVPEAYELTIPEGVNVDQTMVDLATPTFKELGLNNEQASKLIPVAGQFAEKIAGDVQKQITDNHQAQVAAWAAAAISDVEIGGDPAKYAANIVSAGQALDRLGFKSDTPFRQLLTDSGLGNHPEMIRAFVRVGQVISEDTVFVRGGGMAPTTQTAAQMLYPDDVKK